MPIPVAKLFEITVKPRPIHEHPLIVMPEKLEPIPQDRLFKEEKSVKILELGAGWGEFCLEWLESHPEHEYVAFEIKTDRIRKLLKGTRRKNIQNLKIIPVNFNWFLEDILPRNCFDRIIINFPDPWPKKRHWKHRLIGSDFPTRIEKLLKNGGEISAATDYGPYARKILGIFRNSPAYEPVFPWPHYIRTRPPDYPSTRFEGIHLEEGRTPYYQKWRKRSANEPIAEPVN